MNVDPELLMLTLGLERYKRQVALQELKAAKQVIEELRHELARLSGESGEPVKDG